MWIVLPRRESAVDNPKDRPGGWNLFPECPIALWREGAEPQGVERVEGEIKGASGVLVATPSWDRKRLGPLLVVVPRESRVWIHLGRVGSLAVTSRALMGRLEQFGVQDHFLEVCPYSAGRAEQTWDEDLNEVRDAFSTRELFSDAHDKKLEKAWREASLKLPRIRLATIVDELFPAYIDACGLTSCEGSVRSEYTRQVLDAMRALAGQLGGVSYAQQLRGALAAGQKSRATWSGSLAKVVTAWTDLEVYLQAGGEALSYPDQQFWNRFKAAFEDLAKQTGRA